MRFFNEEANVQLIKSGKIVLDEDGEVWCHCEPPRSAIELTVKKEGPNQGRIFFKCDGDDCNLFAWEDQVEKVREKYRLGPDYEQALDPAEIRARAGKKQANHAGGEGQRLGEAPAGPAPRTPLQRNIKEKKRQRVTDSDDEDVKPYPGWDASDDSDIELLPVSQLKKRQLASPDPTPDRKKRQGDCVGAEHEANPFQVDRAVPLALDLGAGDPSAALRIAVQDSYKVNQSLKDKLQKVTARNEELETKVQLLEKEKAEVEDQSRIRALRIQTLEETVHELNRILGSK